MCTALFQVSDLLALKHQASHRHQKLKFRHGDLSALKHSGDSPTINLNQDSCVVSFCTESEFPPPLTNI